MVTDEKTRRAGRKKEGTKEKLKGDERETFSKEETRKVQGKIEN